MNEKLSKVARVSKNLSIALLIGMITSCSVMKGNSNTQEKGESLAVPASAFTTMTLFYPKLDGSGVEKVQVEAEDTQKNTNQWLAQLIVQLAAAQNPQTMPVFPEKI